MRLAGSILAGRWLVGLWLALAPRTLHAGWQEDYLDGRRAYESADFAAAQVLLARALAANPVASADAEFAGHRESYVPQLYLALTYYELGQCDQMQSPRNDAGLLRVLGKLPREARLHARYGPEKCNPDLRASDASQLALTEEPPAAAQTTMATSDSVLANIDLALVEVDRQLATLLAADRNGADFASQLTRMRGRRQQLATTMDNAGRNDAASLASTMDAVSDLERETASLRLAVVDANERARLAQTSQILRESRTRAQAVLAELDSVISAAAGLGLSGERVVAANQQQSLLREMTSGDDATSIDRAVVAGSSAAQRLAAAVADAPAPAAEELRQLVDWYLSGRYEQVVAWEGLEALAGQRNRAHALLLRASSRWHLLARGGAEDRALMAAVDSDLLAAKQLDRRLKPNPLAFSPKLIERFAAL